MEIMRAFVEMSGRPLVKNGEPASMLELRLAIEAPPESTTEE